MAKGGESFFEKFMRKSKEEPLVPLGAMATLGFLGAGLWSFRNGKAALSQQMMRGRIIAQAATVGILMSGGMMGMGLKRQTAEEKILETIGEKQEESQAN
mmetsp:Transcript_31174/g.41243  ORF Transcript_31174/g.41243 Transcript_31174/m.41243 type:complete len:100 (+) Transcript_31174:73-372(+)|eukprot:CAMPEP_0117756434 /NCGR_PEP_ID=MMETSP0947-20121206/14076_1 /TAXON_ID=44440 /ORGANISM="Chattonella subsalsa, Strain CCMP2191" /LENGTH=99 /DNA_ID=CAMNT_0005576021 /DNA_START=72 /DNA_END=371 /DNA_ORIENTATION=+